MWDQSFFMPNFDWLLQCVKDKMDVPQDFTDSPRSWFVTCQYFCAVRVFYSHLQWDRTKLPDISVHVYMRQFSFISC